MKKFSLPKDGGLIEAGLPSGILHSYERIPTNIYEDEEIASAELADEIVGLINSSEGIFKLGLSTGSSPVALYQELVKRYEEGKVSFANVEVFSIDEYYPAPAKSQSRNRRLYSEFLEKVDVDMANVHIPSFENVVETTAVTEYCAEFDRKATGLDFLVMGIGSHGEVGFNEEGASEKSRTRTVLLSYTSRKRQAKNFGGNVDETPRTAIAMGISTMLSAKKIALIGWGEDKAQIVKRIVEDEANAQCPASWLQKHEDITFYADENSASMLTRNVAPWLVGPCEWTPKFIRKAVVWLCEKVDKPILKLTQGDYLANGLGELLEQKDSYDQINIKVFNDLQHTISGWPGGKPNADDSTRPVASTPFPKKVIIFSPHPDDDVISMGGTFIRLVEQGHDVHVAYETSGNVAVHDDVVLQHMDAANELGFGDRFDEVKEIIASKKPGQPEPRALLNLKGAIRRAEAKSAVRSFGLNDKTNCHFLNLPFYETGGIKKGERTQKDIDIIIELLEQVKPHQIYLAGDLADPHGTHRVCTEAVLEAINQLKGKAEWLESCHVWLYRGAWMEWELGKVDMAVPLSPDEVIKKRHAIYRHLSQKDIVPFPGEDPREFWQRAEERTQNTANLYDKLGMAEYQAIEVFVKLF
ncbi:MAG: glucosamine-6-phosphate deaminase [Bacteroidales bacterium]|jgi:glucosamine-6-phosphate deaminase|nr:glucosamine-6-phosphate deaminase [Bacteroidales bacterium]